MKLLSQALRDHIQLETTTLCICWKITLRSGVIKAFTSLDTNLVIDGLTYHATTGGSSTGAPSSLDGSVNSIDWSSFIDDDQITESDLLSGVYDYALVDSFKVNWQAPDDGKIWIQTGRIGDISVEGKTFVAEVRGRRQNLKQVIGEVTSPSCRASLGDSRCKVNKTALIKTGSVTSVVSNREFYTNLTGYTVGDYLRGSLVWTSGANDGLEVEVREDKTGALVLLMLNASHPIAIGDAFEIITGCDKSVEMCKARYSNVINFRGEPFIRGMRDVVSPMGVG